MRVLLVVPPRLLWPFMNEQDNFLLPQSIPCLAGVLRGAGLDVRVIDCLPAKVGWRSLETHIRDLKPDVVAAGEKVMPVHWAFRVFEESAALEPRWHMVVLFLVVLFAMASALVGVATLALLPRREIVT